MKVVNLGSTLRIFSDDLTVEDRIPAGTYDVNFDPMSGYSLSMRPNFKTTEKVYGNHLQMVDRMLDRYNKIDGNFGTILGGRKGTGKSMTARIVSEKLLEQDIPTILVTENTPGLPRFLHQIKYAAISLQPELMIDLLANPTDDELRFARDYLYDQWSPDVDHLKAYLDVAHVDEEPKDYKTKALLTKYLSNVVELDALAKTMTSAQLFTVNHPAWARGYEPEAIATIDTIVRALQRAGYTTKSAYADILFNIANKYQNDGYHYYLEFCADAVSTIKERVRPDTH